MKWSHNRKKGHIHWLDYIVIIKWNDESYAAAWNMLVRENLVYGVVWFRFVLVSSCISFFYWCSKFIFNLSDLTIWLSFLQLWVSGWIFYHYHLVETLGDGDLAVFVICQLSVVWPEYLYLEVGVQAHRWKQQKILYLGCGSHTLAIVYYSVSGFQGWPTFRSGRLHVSWN